MRLRRCDHRGGRVLEQKVRRSACAMLCCAEVREGGRGPGPSVQFQWRGGQRTAGVLSYLDPCLLSSHESGHRHGLREPLFAMSSFSNNRKQISALSLLPRPPQTHRNLSPPYSPLPHTAVHHVEGAAARLIRTASSGRRSSARSWADAL